MRAVAFDLLNHVHAFDDFAEDDVLAVEPGRLGGADEELRTVGVGAGICHAENAWAGVLEREVFVGEFFAVDRFAAGAIARGEIAPLAHEARNHAMEWTAFVAKALFASAQCAEVFGGLGHHIGSQVP